MYRLLDCGIIFRQIIEKKVNFSKVFQTKKFQGQYSFKAFSRISWIRWLPDTPGWISGLCLASVVLATKDTT